ncbi:MAG TPA: sulfatase [Candidatus Paceibacterota bacterium]|nr:sulfatase [Verrucomicrobiota bacterium]HSA12720.1 sulfatase [Candidatus Paceibacterota bacterium]
MKRYDPMSWLSVLAAAVALSMNPSLVAASRQSAAGWDGSSLRRSAETPLRPPVSAGQLPAAAVVKPNVVLILADDLGWTDLGCYGSTYYKSPHIDRLARDGVRFTQAYSACTVCSPSRAAILTGKYPGRLHITDWIPGLPPPNPKLLVPDWTKHLPLEELTLANALRQAGYATASIGKWHLGGEDYYPERHGFDRNIAGSDKPGPPSYFAPYKIPTLTEGPEGEYVTDRLGEEAVRWLDANNDKPFFLYLPHFAVHTPIQGKPDLIRKFRGQKRPGQFQTNEVYAAMVASLDDAVGRVRNKVEELGLADRTVFVFASDNGGRITQGTTSNLPLRAGKGSCYEGGTRTPLIVYWPGVTKPGSICGTPVIGTDLYRTILEAVGAKERADTALDSVSLVPLLRQTGGLKRDELFWHYPHYQHYQLGGTTPYGAIRKGDFKLIEFFSGMRVELYNLRDDIGEQTNLAASMPDKVRELRARLHAWRKEVGAQMPAPNPAYDPSQPEVPPKRQKKT